MFVRVLSLDGNYAGELNIDNMDLIVLKESGKTSPNTLTAHKGEIVHDFKISKAAYQELQRYLSRYGITA